MALQPTSKYVTGRVLEEGLAPITQVELTGARREAFVGVVYHM